MDNRIFSKARKSQMIMTFLFNPLVHEIKGILISLLPMGEDKYQRIGKNAFT